MPINSFSGLGTKLQISISSSYTAIVDVISVSGPEMEQGSRETTVLNPASGWRTFAPTITDPGTIDFQLFLDETDTTQSNLFSQLGVISGGSYAYKLITSDNHTFAFSGFVTKFAVDEIAIDGSITASLSVKLSGAVTWS
jgi:Lambda phage tail tube protein, TTP